MMTTAFNSRLVQSGKDLEVAHAMHMHTAGLVGARSKRGTTLMTTLTFLFLTDPLGSRSSLSVFLTHGRNTEKGTQHLAMRRAAWAMGGEGIEWGNASSGRARGIWRHSVGRYPCISGFLFFSSPFFLFLNASDWDGMGYLVKWGVWSGLENLCFSCCGLWLDLSPFGAAEGPRWAPRQGTRMDTAAYFLCAW
jgi:hypothetical protein